MTKEEVVEMVSRAIDEMEKDLREYEKKWGEYEDPSSAVWFPDIRIQVNEEEREIKIITMNTRYGNPEGPHWETWVRETEDNYKVVWDHSPGPYTGMDWLPPELTNWLKGKELEIRM